MKPFKHEHDHSEQKSWKHIPSQIHQYLSSLFNSEKYRKMPHGSYGIIRSMSWARGEGWRRNHSKSLNKSHK